MSEFQKMKINSESQGKSESGRRVLREREQRQERQREKRAKQRKDREIGENMEGPRKA